LVSDIPAGDGKLVNLFLRCTVYLFTQGRGEGKGELTREKVRGGIVHKASQKYQHD
jgi:hypothetical protein